MMISSYEISPPLTWKISIDMGDSLGTLDLLDI